MKFQAKHDIDAPLDFVRQALHDFDAWERMAMRRGADVIRADTVLQAGPGLTWQVHAHYRGKVRSIEIRHLATDANGQMTFTADSTAAAAKIRIDALQLSARQTRLTIGLEAKPRTLAARLLVQSLRLARSRADKGFAARTGQLAADIEQRYRATLRSQVASGDDRIA